MDKIKAPSCAKPQHPILLSLSQADLSDGMVFLCWLQSEASASEDHRIQAASELGSDWLIWGFDLRAL